MIFKKCIAAAVISGCCLLNKTFLRNVVRLFKHSQSSCEQLRALRLRVASLAFAGRAEALLVAVICLGIIFISTPAYADISGQYLKGSILEQEGDYAGAISLYESIRKEADEPFLYLKLAPLYLASGDVSTAISTLKDGIAAFPKSAELREELGKIYLFSLKDADNATVYLEEANAIASTEELQILIAQAYETKKDYASAIRIFDALIAKVENPDYFYTRGMLYYQLGLAEKAIADIKRAADSGENISAMIRLAEILLEKNKVEEAISYLEKIIESHPGLIVPEFRLANIYRSLKQQEKALALYEQLMDKVTGTERLFVLKQVAALRYDLGKVDEALATFSTILEEAPDDLQSYYFAGYLYELKNDLDNASAVYSKGLTIRGDYAQIIKRVAVVSLKQDRPTDALTALEKIDPIERDMDYYRLAAGAYGDLKKLEDAVKILQRGLDELPQSEQILFDLAVYYEKLDRFDDTVKSLRGVLEVNPNSAGALNFLGYLFADKNTNLKEAEKLIDRALEIEPENPAYQDSKGWVLYRKGEKKKAYEWLVKAAKGAPSEQEIRDHLKLLLDELGIKKTVDDVIQSK